MKDDKSSSEDEDFFLKPKKNESNKLESKNQLTKSVKIKNNITKKIDAYSERTIMPIVNYSKNDKKADDIKKIKENENERVSKDDDKSKKEENSSNNSIEFINLNEIYSYLKIDKKNYFSEMNNQDYDKIKDIISSFNEKKGKGSRIELINEIMKKFLETISPNCEPEALSISKYLSKEIYKLRKLNKNIIEEYINYFFSLRFELLYSTNFFLNRKTLKYLGYILSYVFCKLHKFPINTGNELYHFIKKTIKKKIDVLIDYYNYINANDVKEDDNQNKNKKTYFWKKNRSKYLIPPELNFLINRFIKITTVELELDFKGEEINKEDFKLISLVLLNINYIFWNLSHLKINFINHKLLYEIYNGYYQDLLSNAGIQENIIKKNKINYPELLYAKKWDFQHDFNLEKYRIIEINKNEDKFNNQNLVYDKYNLLYLNNSKKEINEDQMLNSSIEKRSSIIKQIENNPSNVNISNNEKMKNINNVVKDNMKIKNKIDQIIKSKNKYIEIIKNNSKILDLIAMMICSLGRLNKISDLDLIMSDSYNYEFITHLVNSYNIDTDLIDNNFHILDFIYDKIRDLKKLNIELNALDSFNFYKVLNFIHKNESLNSIQLSFFTSDASYLKRSLLKLYNQIIGEADKIIKKKINIENKILNDFLPNFIENLSVLFEILKKNKNMKILGLNFDLPSIIYNNQNYIMPILKFILNILFLIDNNKYKLQKLTILSPSLAIDNKIFTGVNNIFSDIKIYKNNKYLKELNIQIQFYNLINIKNIISTKLIKLNIGDLDLATLKVLVNYLISYKFCTKSNLEKLGIGLNKTITSFNIDLKLSLRDLFNIKLLNLVELNIYTNVIINNKDCNYLSDILKDNWISSYTITFNTKSSDILNKNNNLKNISFFVPHKLENKFLNENEINKIANKDINDDIFWYLKYLFNFKYYNSSSNFVSKKICINSILKYLYYDKKIKIRYTLEEEKKINDIKNNKE